MKSAVILLAVATVAYGFIVREKFENSSISDEAGEISKFTVELQQKILWFIHQHRCNGALITDEWVLVTAQCVQHKPVYANFEVSIGSSRYGVRNIIIHEKADNIAHDIALIRLSSPVNYSDTVSPINLPFPSMEYTDTATLYTKKSSSSAVQVANLDVKSRVDCTDAPRPVSVYHICAGDKQNSAVKGDEGSSLAISDGLSGNVLIGLVSFAKTEPAPAVFTKVSYYVDWILTILEKSE